MAARGAERAPPFIDPPGYARHRPEETLLYQIIEQHCSGERALPEPGLSTRNRHAHDATRCGGGQSRPLDATKIWGFDMRSLPGTPSDTIICNCLR
jgi:hypothetical protein